MTTTTTRREFYVTTFLAKHGAWAPRSHAEMVVDANIDLAPFCVDCGDFHGEFDEHSMTDQDD